jgi:hypothetical protein
MTSLTIEEIAEQRLAYIHRLQKEVKELNEARTRLFLRIYNMQAEFKLVVDENIQLRRIVNEAASLLKPASNAEEAEEE